MRQLAPVRERPARDVDELFGRDVYAGRRELAVDRLPGAWHVAGKAGHGVDHRLGEKGADVEVVQFTAPVLAGGFDRAPNGVELSLVQQPRAEPSLRVLRWPTPRAENNLQHRAPDPLVAAEQSPRRRHRHLTDPSRLRVQFTQRCDDVIGKRGSRQTARGGAVRELRVAPEVRRHLQQMGLAAAEEAADPGRILARRTEIAQVAVQDAPKRIAELPVANEGREFLAEHARPAVIIAVNPGLTVVRQARAARVAVEEVVNLHRSGARSSRSVTASCQVMGWAR